MKRILFAIIFIALVVLPVAEASASRASSTTLKDRLLTTNDLPSGWSTSSSSSSSSSSEAPPKCFAGLSSQKAHNPGASFEKGQNGPQFAETLVASKGTASQLLTRFTTAMNSCGTLKYSSEGVTATIKIAPIKMARVGDKSNGFKMVVSAGVFTVPFYILASEVKNNTLALFTYGDFSGQTSGSTQLPRLARDGIAKLQGKKSPDYGSNAPKAIGQPVKYEGNTVTLVRLIDPAQPANQYETPNAGSRYVAAEFKIVNTGTKAFKPEPTSDATAFDSAAHSYSTDYAEIAGCPSFANNITLSGGDMVDGCVTFQVPAGAQLAKIEYVEQEGAGAGTWLLQPPSTSS